MLSFKEGKIYKDTKGNDWEFLFYEPESKYQYCFRSVRYNNRVEFHEQKDNSVTFWEDGSGVKIPFVEEKERDWVVGEEYECFDVRYPSIYTIKLVEVNNDNKPNKYRFKIGESRKWFMGKGEILSNLFMVVFKNGMPQELKDRINKGKLTNKQKCFQKGQIYKTATNSNYVFKKRVKMKKGLIAVFETEEGYSSTHRLCRINNIECALLGNVFLCHICTVDHLTNGRELPPKPRKYSKK